MSSYDAHLEAFAQSMHADGGWGYAPGQPPQLEPSCLGLLALSLEPERFAEQIEKTKRFIDRNAAALRARALQTLASEAQSSAARGAAT